MHDQSEADWVFATFSPLGGAMWIGLSDFSGSMEWSDGSQLVFSNWASGEPGSTFVAAFVGDGTSNEPGKWYADFAGLCVLPALWKAPGPFLPATATDPLNWDSDGDGISDGTESGLSSIYWDGHGLSGVTGTDPGAFVPDFDPFSKTDPLDRDSDDDGIADGVEDFNLNGAADSGETDAVLLDTDLDGLPDGLEVGLTNGTFDTNPTVFVADADPDTTTDPLSEDSDLGGVPDGIEDQNQDGGVDTWDTDPNEISDDEFAAYLSNVQPGELVHLEIWNATPFEILAPAYSLAGGGPSSTGIGVTLDLTRPISLLDPLLADSQGRGSVDRSKVPASAPHGLNVWFQVVEIPLGSVLPPRVSNPVLIQVGQN